ncbi:Gfo/Idh/MocA family protein [Cyclobacterium jeungdonense]|uniref:Gfo/Idh/MocA family oxidoreductase n=1 Tax=Cyclobacterium jeungdonense TaxID=708087 RepID=A0ABT8C173_9BACT|nr:Gfo/Idh/MocA family oxidoreductase [Cyclobacterium jeungdonense]MDN3686560.1 Gfo/Idh/MocA family oxidoreductase [Cyclobacterium jeungdonense]
MIRAGIIGLGKMGISHCAILGAHPDVNLVAVCDSSSLVIEAFNKHSRFKCFTDYRKMVAEMNLDCIVIASPTKFHAEMVHFALDHSLHVFCEKPFVLNPEDAEILATKAERKNLVNQVGYHNRFLGTFNEVKMLLNMQALGEVYHFSGESYGPVVLREKGSTWRSQKGQGGGCLYDYASHTINLIHYLLDKPVDVAGTQLKRIFSNDVEDAVYSSITLSNGLSGQLSVNWSDETHRKMNTQITVLGKKGKIIADATEVKIFLKEANQLLDLKKGWTIKYLTELTSNVDFYLRGEEYSSQIDHFIKCITTAETNNKSSFRTASYTDQLIAKLITDSK